MRLSFIVDKEQKMSQTVINSFEGGLASKIHKSIPSRKSASRKEQQPVSNSLVSR